MSGIVLAFVGNSYGNLAVPVNTVAPVVSGTATIGQTLSTTNGTWVGDPTPTFTYQWQRNSVNISGATSSTYLLVAADIGNPIRCVVTATNVIGAASANSNQTANVSGIAPVNTVAPVVSGTATVGQTLSTTNGTWTGTPTPTFTYQWQRNSVNISGATSSTYLLVVDDVGNPIRCVVTGTNSAGSASANSNQTTNVSGIAPANTVAPVVSGTATVGQTLSTTNGTWTGAPTPTFTYQWQRNSANIGGATSSTYVLVADDFNTQVRCVVTGTNSFGSVSANSNQTATVAGLLPTNTVAPVVSGTATVGQILSTSNGTWTGVPNPSFTYQWQRNSVNISGANSSTYILVAADYNTQVRCVVTATNSVGAVSANSNQTANVAGNAPVNTVAPLVSGTATVGQTLSTTNGTWTGVPTPTFTYQWQRNGVNILGGTNSTYVLVTADLGNPIRCVVTATNAAGSASANSNQTANVSGTVPTNTVAPVVSGTATVGQTLSTTNGTWTGIPTPTFTYQWQRNGVNISGATSSSYTLVAADYNAVIRCVVTGTNSAGATLVNSNQTANIAGTVPSNIVAPLVSGTATVGQTLSTTNGTWTGTPTPTFTYQWQRSGVNISGATSSSYTLVAADYNNPIRCVVTGTNAAGATSANSNQTANVAGTAPVNTVAPFVSGTATVGQTLSTNNGTWTGTPTPTFAYQWQRSGVNISGATSSSYTLVAADYNNPIRCVVTATNVIGVASANSNQTANVAGNAPVNTVAPVVSGTVAVGQTLSTTNGTWTGVPTPTFSYQWQRSKSNFVSTVNIAGANSSTYTVQLSDVGSQIRCQVTATNAAGASSANSNATSAVPLPAVGTPTGGGYYAGQISTGSGFDPPATHYLIIAPWASGQASRQWKTSNTGGDTGASSLIDGPGNTASINNANYPAAVFCTGLTIGGFTDWYMPAVNELEVCYFNLKPTTTSNNTSSGLNVNSVPQRNFNYTAGSPGQTSSAIFQSPSGVERFDAQIYWTSNNAPTFAGIGYWQSFSNGQQMTNPNSDSNKTTFYNVRAVRRVPV